MNTEMREKLKNFKHEFDDSAIILLIVSILLNGAALFFVTPFPYDDFRFGEKLFLFCITLIIPIALTGLGFCTAFQEIVGYITIPNQREMNEVERSYLMPIVGNVVDRINEVHNLNLNIDDYVFKIFKDSSINAFALGKRNIYVSEGLLYAEFISEEEIEAILAHEFAHLIKKDTVFLAAIVSCNFLIRVMGYISSFFMKPGKNRKIDKDNAIIPVIAFVFNIIFVKILSDGIFTLILRLKSRNAEYRCDAFSASLGYGEALKSFFIKLERLDGLSEINFIKQLYSTHPKTSDRIVALENL